MHPCTFSLTAGCARRCSPSTSILPAFRELRDEPDSSLSSGSDIILDSGSTSPTNNTGRVGATLCSPSQQKSPDRDRATVAAPPSLIEVGFWADPRNPEDARPHPEQFVDKAWGETIAARAVTLYVRSGFLESFELGYSFCRIDGRGGGGGRGGEGDAYARVGCGTRGGEYNIGMGCCTLTDGMFVWPEGLAHYVAVHAVRPPEAFIARAMENLWTLRGAQTSGRRRWCPEKARSGMGRVGVALAPETAVFLRDKTTLGSALPPEPDLESELSDDTVCSCVTS